MAALTKDRKTAKRELRSVRGLVAAGVKCFAGAMAVTTATGFTAPGTTATGLKARGVFTEQVDNTGGADGAETVGIEKGTFKFANDGSINNTHLEANAYIVDDQTVAATDGGTRSAAGRIVEVDSDGVWIDFA